MYNLIKILIKHQIFYFTEHLYFIINESLELRQSRRVDPN